MASDNALSMSVSAVVWQAEDAGKYPLCSEQYYFIPVP